ncbi:unnamed protein product [Ixodes hexagonus]
MLPPERSTSSMESVYWTTDGRARHTSSRMSPPFSLWRLCRFLARRKFCREGATTTLASMPGSMMWLELMSRSLSSSEPRSCFWGTGVSSRGVVSCSRMALLGVIISGSGKKKKKVSDSLTGPFCFRHKVGGNLSRLEHGGQCAEVRL